MQLFADGWYMDKSAAEDCLAFCVDDGAEAVGLIRSKFGWGLLYWADRVLFLNHVIDAENAISAVLFEEQRNGVRA